MTQKPSTNRVMGEEPPRTLNSLPARAMIMAPSTRPMISGRMYCTMAARCIPTPPAMSRRKQAIQKPIFTGLPRATSTTEAMPTTSPARITGRCPLSFVTHNTSLTFFQESKQTFSQADYSAGVQKFEIRIFHK